MIEWFLHLNAVVLDVLVKGSALILFLIISQGVIWFLKFRLRRRYLYDTKDLVNADEIHAISLAYFRRQQTLDIIRAALLLLAILFGVLLYNIQAFSFLALALGAVVINQKENLNSIVAYFYILSNYNVGDDISIFGVTLGVPADAGTLGEVVRVAPMHTTIAGKNAEGEYDGRRIVIPNYQFLLNPIERRDLKSDSYRLVVLSISCDPHIGLDAFLSQLRPFLDELLPKRSLSKVGPYRGFTGVHYKLDFDTNGGSTTVTISFVVRARDAASRKESIITFVEGLAIKPVKE